MGVGINDKSLALRLNRAMRSADKSYQDSVSKLSTGSVFAGSDPKPAERALADKLEYRIRSLTTSKQNINEAVSLLQTADGGMNEISNILVRMKEISTAAASSTVSNSERRFLLVEYDALHDEVNRITKSTEYNGVPLLNGESEKAPESLVLRVGDPFFDPETGEDINTISLDNIKDVMTTTEALGVKSVFQLLSDSTMEEGISFEDAAEILVPEDDNFETTFDKANYLLTKQRSVYGAIQSRLNRSMDYIDVYQENLAAAKSKIADADYAEEVSNMVKSKMLMSTATALLSQTNIQSKNIMTLIHSIAG